MCSGNTGAVRRGEDLTFQPCIHPLVEMLLIQEASLHFQTITTLASLSHLLCRKLINQTTLSARDAKCGKIQCLTSAFKPIQNTAVRIESTVTVGNKKIHCMGTHVYKHGQEQEDTQGDTLDPGLVMTGTKCGDGLVRYAWRCTKENSL